MYDAWDIYNRAPSPMVVLAALLSSSFRHPDSSNFLIMNTALTSQMFSAMIEVDGKPIRVYQPSWEGDGKRVIGWIASEAGKEYNIKYLMRQFIDDCTMAVAIDGTKVQEPWIFEEEVGKVQDCGGVETTENVERPFCFTKVRAKSGKGGPWSRRRRQRAGYGSIKLTIRRAVAGDPAPWQTTVVAEQPKSPKTRHSRTALHHNTTYGAARPIRSDGYRKLEKYHDSWKTPYLTVEFRYLPFAILQEKGIAPMQVDEDVVKPEILRELEAEAHQAILQRSMDGLQPANEVPQNANPAAFQAAGLAEET